MTHYSKYMGACLLALVSLSPSLYAGDEADTTLSEMAALNTATQSFQDNVSGALPAHYDGNMDTPRYDELSNYIKAVQSFDEQYKAKGTQTINAFTKKWGADLSLADDKIEAIINPPSNHGLAQAYASPSRNIKIIQDGMASVALLRQAIVESMVHEIDQDTANIARMTGSSVFSISPDKYTAIMASAKAVVSDLGPAEKAITQFKSALSAAMATEQDAINQRTFPDSSIAINQGNAGALTSTAEEWFRQSKGWGARSDKPYTILSVVITDQWKETQHNLSGDVLQWGLPIKLAVQLESDKANNVARAFNITILTETHKGVKQAPPWADAAVGSSYILNADNVGASHSNSSSGIIAKLLWLTLSLVAMVSGFIGAKEALQHKHDVLAKAYALVLPHSIVIGLTALALATAAFIWSILSLHLFSGIILQVSALLMGLLLAKDIVTKKVQQAAESDNEISKGAAIAMAQQANLNKVVAYQSIIGLGTLSIGLVSILSAGSLYFI